MKSNEFVEQSLHLSCMNKKVRLKILTSKYRDPFEKELYFRQCYNSKNCLSAVFRFSDSLDRDTKYYNFFTNYEEFEIELIEV